MEERSLLAEYGRAWCIHQLLPHIDRLFGISGAMDFRPINVRNDLACRLPLVLACLVFPTRYALVAAHVVNVISWGFWMPAVWDHMVWVALTEMLFVACRGKMRTFLPAVRCMLVVLYFSAAFWKLTTSFLDPRSSCANTLVAELAAALFRPSQIPADGTFAKYLMLSAPAQVVGIEFLVPIVLWLAPRAGICTAIIFHFTINLMPVTYAGGFSIAMCSRLVVFFPGSLSSSIEKLKAADLRTFAVPVALGAGLLALFLHCHEGNVDASGFAFLSFSVLYFRSAFASDLPGTAESPTLYGAEWILALVVSLAYGFGAPVFGVMAMASSTMYGNLKQFGGPTNHLLVPTGLFQKWFRDTAPAGFLFDAFGGGMVRIEDSNSTALFRMLHGADISADQPPHARAILDATGSSGKYYEFYASRNYYYRDDDHAGTALTSSHDAAAVRDRGLKFAAPAYELRRLLTVAAERDEAFFVDYVKLPRGATTPTQWRLHDASMGARFTAFPDGSVACVALRLPSGKPTKTPCDDDEIALLPPPQRWLRFFLHPYPTPLLEGVDDEIVCTT